MRSIRAFCPPSNRLLVLIHVYLLLVSVDHSTPLQAAELSVQIKRLAAPYVESETVVGLSVGAIKGDESVSVHMGRIRANGSVPNDATMYELGSISKVFTGILAADAVHQDRIQLDQPAQELLPADVSMPRSPHQPITMRHLLLHRSGLPRIADNMPMANVMDPYADYPSGLAYEFLNSHELRYEPGSKSEYSNFGMALAGLLVGRAQQLTYGELLSQRLTTPLQMDSTAVKLTDEQAATLATPHIAGGTATIPWDFSDMPGAGGIRSTTADMLRFASAHLNVPKSPVGNAIDLAWKEHAKSTKKQHALGLGWHIAHDGSTRWHSGQTGGSHGMILINRTLKIAVVVLSNTASLELDQLGQDIVRMLAGADVEPRAFRKYQMLADDVMQRYVGRYRLSPKLVFTVAADDGKLMVELTGQPRLQVFPTSETRWEYKAVEASIEFHVDANNECSALTIHQNGVSQRAKKVP